MKKLVLFLVLAVSSTPAFAAFTLRQQQGTVSATATTNTRTLTSVVAGSTLTVMVGNRSSATLPTGISDTVNGAWNLSNGVSIGSGIAAGIYYFPNSAAGSPVITVTYAGSVINLMSAQEWGVGASGVTTESSNSNNNTGSPTTHSHGSVTTAGAGLILTAAAEGATLTETANASFTALTDNNLRLWPQYWITTSGQTTDGAFTTSVGGDSVGVILALVEPSSSSNAPRAMHYRRLMH